MNEAGFIHPSLLWGLVLIPAIAYFVLRSERTRSERCRMFGLPPAGSLLKPACICALSALMLIAAARPYLGYTDLRIAAASRDFLLLVDVSRSMFARDVPPSRMEFVRHKLDDLITFVENAASGDRLGIVLFADQAYLFCPLTADYGVLRIFAQSASPDLITAQGTNFEDAINTAIESFNSVKAAAPLVILLSDGEDKYADAAGLAEKLKKAGVTLYALGVGSREGAPIDLGKDGLLKTKSDYTVISHLDEATLRAIAESSGGMYQRAAFDDSDLRTIFSPKLLPSLSPGAQKQRSVRSYHEIGPFLIWTVILFIFLVLLSGKPALLFCLAFFLAGYCRCAHAQDAANAEAPSLYDAYSDYQAGRYAEALKGFQYHYDKGNRDPRVLQGLAGSHFRNGNYAHAEKIFDQLADQAVRGRDKYRALYNRGNAELAQDRYEDAVKSYEQALKIKPEDEPAKFNMALARKRLEQQKSEPSPQEQRSNERKKPEQQQENQQQPSPTPVEQPKQPEPQPSAQPSSHASPSPSTQPSEGARSGSQSSPTPSPTDSAGAQASPSPAAAQSRAAQSESPAPSPTVSMQPSPQATTASRAAPSPTPSGSVSLSPSPAASASGQPSQLPRPMETESSAEPAAHQKPTPVERTKLSSNEARQWLESLPDAPILLRRKVSRLSPRTDQTW